MAHPDIHLMDATFPAVPSVLLPKDGGGQAEFFDMSDPMSFLGKGVELVDDDLYSATFALKDTDFHGWTPSTTAKVCVPSVTKSAKFTARDMENYEYYIVWEMGVDLAYTGSPTLKAHTLFSRSFQIQEIFRRPGSWATIQSEAFNTNVCNSVFTPTFLRYYNSSGSLTYTFSASYGFYFTMTAATFSSTSASSPTVNLKTPTMSARCSTSYMSTGNAALIDQDNSSGFIRGKLYRIKRDGFLRGAYNNVIRLLNE